ncbi:MAG: glycosyltransferase family 52 [bacterium]|nr:glycosyltransferase family 52 [bacterium]
MVEENLFICNTPFQFLISQIFTKHFKVQADLIHTIPFFNLLKYNDRERWKECKYIRSLSPKGTDLISLSYYRFFAIKYLITGLKLNKNKYDNVYIFNDCDITNQIILKNLKFKKLIYLDDGLIIGSEFISPPELSRKAALKYKIWSMAGLYPNNFVSYDKRINELYLFNSHLSDRKNLSIKDLGEIVIKNSDYIYDLSQKLQLNLDEYLNPDYIILSQPLFEQGICGENEDVNALSDFIKKLPPNSKIVFKMHPSENSKKYEKIITRNIKVLESYKHIPYELLHFKLKPINIVSFFSTALFTSQYFYGTKIISLLKSCKIANKSEYVNLLDKIFQNSIIYV